MKVYGETTFDILYLVIALVVGISILMRSKNKLGKLMGIATLILGFGDAFHLVPRILNNFNDSDYTAALGIGKLAGSLLAVGGVKAIYADVMSEYAIPVMDQFNIEYEYKTKVPYIINKDKTGMCPMENKFKDVENIQSIYDEIIKGNVHQ